MSTNPFDDDDLPPPRHIGRSTNPFGDEDDITPPLHHIGSGGGGGGPSAIIGERSSNYNDTPTSTVPSPPLNSGSMSQSAFLNSGGGDASMFGPSSSSSMDNNESSWQDLGDLPYRRVRLYSDVLWGQTKKNDNT